MDVSKHVLLCGYIHFQVVVLNQRECLFISLCTITCFSSLFIVLSVSLFSLHCCLLSALQREKLSCTTVQVFQIVVLASLTYQHFENFQQCILALDLHPFFFVISTCTHTFAFLFNLRSVASWSGYKDIGFENSFSMLTHT